ncbi:hypothetical protein COO91_06074 [Nostoc flagelliforme CCNUN1]|uniref:Uncharacterized protein n=1 Tax=Nostoc flagelliforme CCNUN1 TaxID=2038116 RepID=A0A2K8SXA9_9NOSO|nr:hypothetical protein [Nostoc flagelliforme]AUB40074.1 hypothetical protein COO91_06074 [Nostoc flagelliforme CCNUN1]
MVLAVYTHSERYFLPVYLGRSLVLPTVNPGEVMSYLSRHILVQ